jgi:sec-independent protein translocase protein TatC
MMPMAVDQTSMGLFDHIKEMRQRLFRSVIALLITTVISSMFVNTLVSYLVSPLEGGRVIVLSPTEAPIIYFKIALAAGFGLALPYILYQIYGFIAPGLYPNEKNLVLYSVPAVLLFFIAGAVFTLEILIPVSMPVLMGFLGEVVQPTYSLENYLSFITTLVLWMGLLFQTPLAIYIVSRFGLVTTEQLTKARRIVWFVAAIFAAVVTPTTDPVTLLLVTGPFITLYELGILLSRLAGMQRKRKEEALEAEEAE